MKCIWEHNGNDTLLYSAEYIGASTRGKNLDTAIAKMKAEIDAYSLWSGQIAGDFSEIEIVQEKTSTFKLPMQILTSCLIQKELLFLKRNTKN